jgi:2-polyprenyl-3-methyl-5-hydroxy-6-metoxy-1,4-benzoquinol methylase
MDSWDAYAAEWDENADAQKYSELAFECLRDRVFPSIANLDEAHVLDFGCGTGLLTEKLAPLCAKVMAIDTSAKMIEVLKSKILKKRLETITPLVGTIDKVSIAEIAELSEKFDLITASSVCSFLPDYRAALRDLSSMLKPCGVFVQWDWLSDMPIEYVSDTYEAVGLNILYTEEVFKLGMGGDVKPVVMGVAQSPA